MHNQRKFPRERPFTRARTQKRGVPPNQLQQTQSAPVLSLKEAGYKNHFCHLIVGISQYDGGKLPCIGARTRRIKKRGTSIEAITSTLHSPSTYLFISMHDTQVNLETKKKYQSSFVRAFLQAKRCQKTPQCISSTK